jgi:hypothetical protein
MQNPKVAASLAALIKAAEDLQGLMSHETGSRVLERKFPKKAAPEIEAVPVEEDDSEALAALMAEEEDEEPGMMGKRGMMGMGGKRGMMG